MCFMQRGAVKCSEGYLQSAVRTVCLAQGALGARDAGVTACRLQGPTQPQLFDCECQPALLVMT